MPPAASAVQRSFRMELTLNIFQASAAVLLHLHHEADVPGLAKYLRKASYRSETSDNDYLPEFESARDFHSIKYLFVHQ